VAEVDCTRCGRRAAGLAAAPMPGEVGQAVLASTCSESWKVWLGAQVKLINEHRISPADPSQYDFLVSQLREFLKLPSSA